LNGVNGGGINGGVNQSQEKIIKDQPKETLSRSSSQKFETPEVISLYA